jgi:hypothetical protein
VIASDLAKSAIVRLSCRVRSGCDRTDSTMTAGWKSHPTLQLTGRRHPGRSFCGFAPGAYPRSWRLECRQTADVGVHALPPPGRARLSKVLQGSYRAASGSSPSAPACGCRCGLSADRKCAFGIGLLSWMNRCTAGSGRQSSRTGTRLDRYKGKYSIVKNAELIYRKIPNKPMVA